MAPAGHLGDLREDGLEVVLVQDKVADEGTDGDLAAARGGGDGFVVREVGLEPSGHLLVVDDVSDVEESEGADVGGVAMAD